MSKFTHKAPPSSKKPVAVANLAGGKGFAQSPEIELVSHLLTSFAEEQFYRSVKDSFDRLETIITRCDPVFVAKAAIYARHKFHMRSVTHVTTAMLSRLAAGEDWKRPFFNRVIQRPDDAVEIVAFYLSRYGKPLPSALKRGVADAMTHFSPYHLAKYRGGSGSLSLIDVVNLTHPKSTPALDLLMKGDLPPADTWEVGLSQAGEDPAKKREVWKRLVDEDKLGYMAMLRNLNNLHKQASAETVATVLERLADPKRVASSRQLPFRFWNAMNAAGGNGPHFMIALDIALGHSVGNVPTLSGKTLVAADFSGSMNQPLSKLGSISLREIATLLGVTLARKNDADFAYFGNHCKFHTIHPTDSIMGQMKTINKFNTGAGTWAHGRGRTVSETSVGHGTDIGSIFRAAAGRKYDRVIVLSDLQTWVGDQHTNFSGWKRDSKADPFVYSIDLAGHGASAFKPNGKTFQLAGFSDKIFDLIHLAEQSPAAMVAEVESILF